MTADLKSIIDEAWEDRAHLSSATKGKVRDAVMEAIEGLDCGRLRVAEKQPDHPEAVHGWVVNQWLKKAVLLHFRLHDAEVMQGTETNYFDKIPAKCHNWGEKSFKKAGFRIVPPATARKGAYLAPGVVLMPSFVNIGAYVDSGAMVDTWATVGSCAQVGRNVHISGGAGIGGVLEPLQANPVILEDHCFIGARAEVAEGVIVGEGAVLSMGVYLGRSTKIVNRATGEVLMGYVPPFSVVVSGTMPGKPLPDGSPGPNLYCAVIVKQVDAQTRAKTSINELLRD
ncbi:MAG: 2,3,4,5-tetrahydropyridine-2,6-dicarboxylate N-succinyltransferase [Magnetococcales bacterium]|nr:2,3,4,5-tetrahydropyridine-2,6-dicarboxylate N-succinyltransferase [Magnetococcales bacterium]